MSDDKIAAVACLWAGIALWCSVSPKWFRMLAGTVFIVSSVLHLEGWM